MSALVREIVPSPLGPLSLVATDVALVGVYFAERDPPPSSDAGAGARPAVLDHAARELAEYFEGARQGFSIPLEPRGTPFQRAVWQALAAIPFGVTWSYADLARAIGRPSAVRAVGAANGRNPLPVVIPCHRVIGADGKLVGFGGGLDRKRWLLAHEGADGVAR